MSVIDLALTTAENYIEQQRLNEAEFILNNILKIKPVSEHALHLQGMLFYSQHKYKECIHLLLNQIKKNKLDVGNYNNISLCYMQLRDDKKTIEYLLKALEVEPENVEIHLSLSMAYFLNNQWDKGWFHYEYRLKNLIPTFYDRYPKEKAWNGKDSLENKKILVYCEQGLGDYINFIRFIPLLKEKGADVYLEAKDNLNELISNFGILNQDSYDFHCSIMSLPYFLNIKTHQFIKNPYINICESFDLSNYKDNFKIGIVWAGSSIHNNDKNRSCELKCFLKLTEIESVQLFSLQKDNKSELPNNIIDLSNNMTNFLDTAKIINSLDLIITVDTATLHLAGAMGKETWALIAHKPDWRWTAEGSDNLWYESVTLFRQPQRQDWKSVFDIMENKLKERLIK